MTISGNDSLLRNADVGHILELREKLAESDKEVARWKRAVIPFLAIYAAQYGKDIYGDNCMHCTHYDLLEEAGGRMDSYKRCGDESQETQF